MTKTRIRTTSGAALRNRRDDLSHAARRTISQEEIADRTGGMLSQKQISALETGTQEVSALSVGRANALAAALEWTLWEMQKATGENLYARAPGELAPRFLDAQIAV